MGLNTKQRHLCPNRGTEKTVSLMHGRRIFFSMHARNRSENLFLDRDPVVHGNNTRHLFRIFLSDTLQNSFLRPFIYCADLQYDHQNND